MRRGAAVMMIVSIVAALGAAGASHAGPTLAGSAKAADGNLTCGSTGKLGEAGNINAYANSASDRSEVEVCSDRGAGNEQGRVVVRVNHNTTSPGARVTLDSDRDQTPQSVCCGYINAQAGTQGSGVWCSEDGGSGDGYSQSWATPGQDGMAGNEPGDRPGPLECAPAEGNLP